MDLPPEAQIHPTFHVSCLKKKLGAHVTPLTSLPLVDKEGAIQPEPEAILERRVRRQGDRPLTKALVHWKGTMREDATWVPFWQLRDQYLHLVSKVF